MEESQSKKFLKKLVNVNIGLLAKLMVVSIGIAIYQGTCYGVIVGGGLFLGLILLTWLITIL